MVDTWSFEVLIRRVHQVIWLIRALRYQSKNSCQGVTKLLLSNRIGTHLCRTFGQLGKECSHMQFL